MHGKSKGFTFAQTKIILFATKVKKLTNKNNKMSKEIQDKRTFGERYKALKDVATPMQEFVSHYAELTHRSENAVRMWISGERMPDALAQDVISKDMGVPADILFPKKD